MHRGAFWWTCCIEGDVNGAGSRGLCVSSGGSEVHTLWMGSVTQRENSQVKSRLHVTAAWGNVLQLRRALEPLS